MAKAKLVKHNGVQGIRFKCPGCECSHFVYIENPNEWGYCWGFNGDLERPTLTPSVDGESGGVKCHSFVTDGKIQYLSDCTHPLAGQTVDLPEMEANNA